MTLDDLSIFQQRDIMVHQTTIQKAGKRLKFLDDLLGDGGKGTELRKDTRFLVDDYVGFTNLAASLSSHSKWIPYPFLIDRMKKIADEIRGFADLLRGKIVELGGQIPSDALRSPATQNRSGNGSGELQHRTSYDMLKQDIKRLLSDVEDHTNRCELLQHQRNLIGDAGVSRLLGLIIVDMQRQKDELIDIVMRVS